MELALPVFVKQAIYWLSFLYFPLAGALLWQIFVRKSFRILSILALIPLTVLAYARFIEPQRLLIVEHEVEICGEGLPGTLRAAVVADLHLGIFPHAISTERVVKHINGANVDLVLMPGDFTYHLEAEKFDKTFAAFSKLDMPAYAVMGNHDVGLPGPDVAAPLTEALEKVGVTILNAKEAIFSADGKFLRIIGFRDYWAHTKRNEDLGEMPEKASGMPIIFLQHNPDMMMDPDLKSFDLMVSGHTHGGQIYIPGVTCHLTFACRTSRYGYSETPLGKLFVTSGTGMVGLPLRLGVPPRIDVLNMKLRRCRDDINNLV